MAEGPNIFSAVVLELAEDNSVKSFERILFKRRIKNIQVYSYKKRILELVWRTLYNNS